MYKADDWGPDQIIVKRSGKEVSTFLAKSQSIKCPLQCSLTIMNPKPNEDSEKDGTESAAAATSPDSSDSDTNADSSEDDGSRASTTKAGEDSSKQDGFSNSYNGGGLSAKEAKNLLELGCEDKIKDNDNFGPKYGTKQINFESFIAICPKDCWKPGSAPVFGVGIHPEEASICRSAIVDRSMPYIGGVIGIGISHGLNSYEAGHPYAGLEVKSYKSSSKSFFTFKVDNVDFVNTDFRILDQRGGPSHIGRLEFRINGVWGSVCSKKMTNSAAKRICRQLRYQDGTLKSMLSDPTARNSFCRTYKGDDFCAPNPTPIHYMSMNCDGIDGEDIMKCYREIADNKKCMHDDDAIIECSNVDYEYPVDPLPGTVRLVDDVGAPSIDGTGRLEFFMGKYGSVCNSKFTDKAAHVACKQMGYLSGKIMGTPGETGFCTKYKGKNYCGNQQINLNDVDCKGTEDKLKECGGSTSVTTCNHEQDMVISCEGNNGDPTGKSQQPAPEMPSPQFGKLALLPIITAKCDTRFNEPIFRGDPGSIFLVNCPASCTTSGGVLWGTGIYTADSSICKAAIHAGVLQDDGGLVEVIKQPGLNLYQASTHRAIISTNFNKWPVSFSVSKPNSVAVKMSTSIKGKEKDGGPTPLSSFVQLEEAMNLQKLGSKPVFSWFPPITNFQFDGTTTKVKTQGMTNVEKTNELVGSLAIATRIVMNKSPNRIQTLISHSGCGGFVLEIKATNELSFGQRCSENMFDSGYIMPLNIAKSIVINYDGKNVEIYIDGERIHRKQLTFIFKLEKNLDIGGFSENSQEIFNGQISYALFFDNPIDPSLIKQLAKNSIDPNKKGEKLKNVYTVDNRLCISACTKNPIPGTPGCSVPPADAQPNQGDYPDGKVHEGLSDADVKNAENNGNAENSEQPQANSIQSASNEAEKKNEEVNEESTNQLKCDLQVSEKKFQGPTGKSFRVSCPKNCAKHPEGNVFGNLIYSDDSSVCKAAIHAGFVKDAEGGEFLVEITNGLAKYESSFKNDITSAARGASIRSFTLKEAPALTRISCDEAASSSKFVGANNAKFTVLCLPDCSKIPHKVYGVGPFTDDSSVCQAAIFTGVLTDKGGEVSFVIAEGQSSYKASTSNGIKSTSRDTYIRSFKVLGSSKTACQFFKEKYDDNNVLTHWKIINAKGLSTTKLGVWSFVKNPLGAGLAIKQTNDPMGSEYNYGSSLIYKDFECGEGVYNVNVYMDQAKTAAILFRYLDENNFYALEMNQPGDKKMRFVKKSQGTGTVLKATSQVMEAKEWYRFKISFHFDLLQVWLQKGSNRNVQLIFNISDNDVQRGTVGVATQGNGDVYFDGVGVHEYDPKYGVFNKQNKEQRIWDGCLTGADEGHRKKYCIKAYGSYLEGRKRCEELHNFCEICCDRTIPKLENTLNYACWKGCVKVYLHF